MEDDLWQRVDGYLEDKFIDDDEALQAALRTSKDAGLPAIQVSPLQGKFLQIIARLLGARRVLEIGSLGGYSAIWLGRALPTGGRMITLEVNPKHAEVARANLERAGLSGTVEVRVGPALETLPKLADEVGEATFDLAFIDADKPNNPGYFAWAKRLVRPGGAVVVDNVVREGRIAENGGGADVVGTRQLFDAMAASPGISASALQTVGAKGYDGFALAIVEP